MASIHWFKFLLLEWTLTVGTSCIPPGCEMVHRFLWAMRYVVEGYVPKDTQLEVGRAGVDSGSPPLVLPGESAGSSAP